MKLMKGSISREERGAFLKKFVELGAVRSKRLRSTDLRKMLISSAIYSP